MERRVGRAASFRDYSSVKGKRRLEVLAFVLPAVVAVVATISYLISKRLPVSRDEESCTYNSTQYMESISEYLKWDRNGDLVTVDGMVYPPGKYWTLDNETAWGCPCLLKPCVSKCCGRGETHFFEDYHYPDGRIGTLSMCDSHDVPLELKHSAIYSAEDISNPVRVAVKNDHFFIVEDNDLCEDMYNVIGKDMESAFLLEDGRLLRTESNKRLWNHNEFCVESTNDSLAIHFMVCFLQQGNQSSTIDEPDWHYILKSGSMLVSVPFFLITLFVYALLPQLNNLHGKTFMCYISCLTVGYFCLALLTFVEIISHKTPKTFCVTTAFIVQFFVLTSFFWLNVMCFDIWWVFSGLMPLRGSQKEVEQFKFLMYSLYAWGCPLAILIVSLVMEFAPGISENAIRPKMGIERCFFTEDDAKLLYFYLPIGVIVYFNIAMFFTTSLRFKSHSKSVKKLQRGDSRRHCQAGSSTTDMERFNIYLKLFVVMGLNWVFELLSFFFKNNTHFFVILWMITDVFNSLLGIFIFYMFVCKRPILRQLNQKISFSSRRPILSGEGSVRTMSSARSNSTGGVPNVRRKVSEQSTASSCDTSV